MIRRLPFSNNNIILHTHHASTHNLHSFSLVRRRSGRRKPPLSRGVRMDSAAHHRSHGEKVVVIMGATGCGKSRLSIDLATRFDAEIVNSDKMQLYRGLDITTNKITIPDRRGVPHHLLGDFDPFDGEVTPSEFRLTAGLAIADINSRQKPPIVAGGSNSFIHALLVERYHPNSDVFDGSDPVSTQLRYNCCFIWVDVSLPVLCDYLCRRVDEMLESGMLEELSEYFGSGRSASEAGLGKAIGVPELERYFKKYPPGPGTGVVPGGGRDQVRRGAYEEAVREIKENTCQLAKRQIGKMMKLKKGGWDLQRLDATAAFREMMTMREPVPSEEEEEEESDNYENKNKNNWGKKNRKKRRKRKKKRWMEIWEKEVVQPSVKIVKTFLEGE